MRSQTGDIAGVMFALILLVGLSQTYTAPPLGFDMADNPFDPYNQYNPATQTGMCHSLNPCNSYDFVLTGGGTGTCQYNTPDTDGDTFPSYVSLPVHTYDWTAVDEGCFTLQDWDQDGTCDHRFYDEDRDQIMTAYQPTNQYFTHIGLGFWAPQIGPSICTGWVGV